MGDAIEFIVASGVVVQFCYTETGVINRPVEIKGTVEIDKDKVYNWAIIQMYEEKIGINHPLFHIDPGCDTPVYGASSKCNLFPGPLAANPDFYDKPCYNFTLPGKIEFFSVFCDINKSNCYEDEAGWRFELKCGVKWGIMKNFKGKIVALELKQLKRQELAKCERVFRSRFPKADFRLDKYLPPTSSLTKC